MGGEDVQRGLHLRSGNNDAHAHAHVVGVEHVPLGNIAGLCNQVEDGQHLNGALVDLRAQAVGDGAGNILIETAAGDVADALDVNFFQQRQNGLDVDLRGGQQGLGDGFPAQRIAGPVNFGGVLVNAENLADQAEAVGVNAGGSQRDDHVPFRHFRLV